MSNTSTSTQGFGKPKYGSSNFTKTIKLKEGQTTVVRILPPMKSLAETGEWAKYIGTHYGYKGVNPKDASKPQFRPFKCIQVMDFRTRMITQECPECDLIDQRKEDLKAAKAQYEVEKRPADEIKELTKPLNDWLSEHNCDRKWHMNVKTQAGEFGVLQISHKTKKLLDAKIADILTTDQIDALDLETGVWFAFKRTGKGIETQDTVDVEYESVRDSVSGRITRTIKLAPVSEAEAMQALRDCPDLANCVREISFAQIQLLVNSSGEPEDVDRILAMGQRRESSPTPRQNAASDVLAQRKVETAGAVATTMMAATPQAPVNEPEAESDDEEAALEAALAAAKAKKAAAKAAVDTNAATATSAPAKVTENPAPDVKTPAPVDRAAFMAQFRRPTTTATPTSK